jgi:peptidoglycan-associated lipoprotein
MKIPGMNRFEEMTMSKLFRTVILLAASFGLLLLGASRTSAQTFDSMELGGNYDYVRTNAPPGGCGCFSMNGGSGWFGYNFNSRLGLVGEVGSEFASNINGTSGSLTLTSYLFGPRYSWHHTNRVVPFGQLLLGGAYGSGALTPTASGRDGSANAFAMTVGGGMDVPLTRHLALRTFQIDYYLTRFTNDGNDHQNNLRIGFGMVYRFGRKR